MKHLYVKILGITLTTTILVASFATACSKPVHKSVNSAYTLAQGQHLENNMLNTSNNESSSESSSEQSSTSSSDAILSSSVSSQASSSKLPPKGYQKAMNVSITSSNVVLTINSFSILNGSNSMLFKCSIVNNNTRNYKLGSVVVWFSDSNNNGYQTNTTMSLNIQDYLMDNPNVKVPTTFTLVNSNAINLSSVVLHFSINNSPQSVTLDLTNKEPMN